MGLEFRIGTECADIVCLQCSMQCSKFVPLPSQLGNVDGLTDHDVTMVATEYHSSYSAQLSAACKQRYFWPA